MRFIDRHPLFVTGALSMTTLAVIAAVVFAVVKLVG
jgi:hypothetical protein